MELYPYIAIEGAIGVGKTTLARMLGEHMSAEVLLEVFEENPFLGDFYADRARYAFQTQIFFLLSRYRQQHRVIPETIRRSALVSDYLFAKDWLFAHLNLAGDELAMYERVHSILGEQIPTPELVIHLRASTETLMERIRFRDRPYERQMSQEYAGAVRLAYEQFFANYTTAPLLVIDTDGLDFAHNPEARSSVLNQVRNALEATSFQPPLPEMDIEPAQPTVAHHGRRLPDLQRFHRVADRQPGVSADLFLDYIQLTERMGALGRSFSNVWLAQDRALSQVGNREEARDRALQESRVDVEDQLAEILAHLLRVANDSGIDLERAYLQRFGGDSLLSRSTR